MVAVIPDRAEHVYAAAKTAAVPTASVPALSANPRCRYYTVCFYDHGIVGTWFHSHLASVLHFQKVSLPLFFFES